MFFYSIQLYFTAREAFRGSPELLAATLLTVAAPAAAGDAVSRVPVIFGDLDLDRSNRWEADELELLDAEAADIELMDADGDGAVSRNEYNAYSREHGAVTLPRDRLEDLILPDRD